MKKFVASTAAVAALLCAGAAAADPSHNVQVPFTQTCSNGMTIEVQPGTLKNQSSVAFVTTSNQVVVAKSLTVEVEGVGVVYSFERGLRGFAGRELVTCVGSPEPGITVTVTGFITPGGP